jgi:hypothetical protein
MQPKAQIRIYQKSTSTIVLVDEVAHYESCDFTRSRSGIGNFTITMGLDAPKASSFVKNYLVQIGTDLRRIGVITGIEKSFSQDGEKRLVITGYEAKGYCLRRRILPPSGSAYYTLTDDAETCIKNLITDNIGASASTKRKINHVNVIASAGTGATYTLSARYDNLADQVKTIAESANMGWDFRLNLSTSKLDVTTYLGTDRRSSQSVNPRAIFSTDWNSLASASAQESISDLKNLAIVAGQGEGENRAIRQVYSGTEPESDERIEDFIDARDLESNTALDARGASFLAENSYTIGLDAEALQAGLVFGTDYDVGDRVTISALGVTADSYITAATERFGADGYRVSLQFDKQTQTSTQSINSRVIATEQTLARIEDDKLGSFKNKIINGRMDIWQRGTSFTPASGSYVADRFVYGKVGSTGTVTISRDTNVPNNTFLYSMKVDVTASETIDAGDFFEILQRMEGYNVRSLIGKTFAVSFWVSSPKAGIHCVAFVNGGLDRSYITEYTVNVANTWEYKTVTVIGGLITTGTPGTWTNDIGLNVVFMLACGSTFQTTPNAWQSSTYLATSSQQNCMDTVGNLFYITGIQLEEGATATSFEQRPFGVEFHLCLRYFYRWVSENSTRYVANMQAFASSGAFGKIIDLPVPMRIAPTCNPRASSDFSLSLPGSSSAGSCTLVTFSQNTTSTISGVPEGVTGLTAGNCTVLVSNNSAYINCDAEL